MEDNRPGRKAPGGTGRAGGTRPARPAVPSKSQTDAQSLMTQSLMADELPDGLVVADDAGRVVVYNRAAVRLTGIAASDAIGKYVYDVLPFRDDDGRDWWMFVDPYNGLATRTRHPERSLFLADGPPAATGGRQPGAAPRCWSRSATCATAAPARCAAW